MGRLLALVAASWPLRFSLSEEFIAINDNLAVVALFLAVMDIALVFLCVGFARKAKKQTLYTDPLPEVFDKKAIS